MNDSNVSTNNAFYQRSIIGGSELNYISLILAILTIIFTTAIVLIVATSEHQNKRSTPVLLSCNTYLAVFLYSTVSTTQYLRTWAGDFETENGEGMRIASVFLARSADFPCQLNAFFQYASLTNVLFSVNVKAFFRVVRVTTPLGGGFRLLKTWKGYGLIVIIQWIMAFSFQLPNILIDNQYSYEATQFNCIIVYSNTKASVYGFLSVYIIPCVILIAIYIYLVVYLRRHRTRVSPVLANHHAGQQRRDILVIKPIILSVGVLVSMGFSSLFLMAYYALTKTIFAIRYRIQWFNVAFSIAIFSVLLLIVSPQLIELLPRCLKTRKTKPNPVRQFLVNVVPAFPIQ